MSADKFCQSVGFVVRPPPNHWPADPARDSQHTVGQQFANHVLDLTKWQHTFLCKSANQWPLWMCADFGPKWQGSVSWKCHFRRDLHQASSRVTMSTAWLTDVRRRKCVAISCFALQRGSSLLSRHQPCSCLDPGNNDDEISTLLGSLGFIDSWQTWKGHGV